MSRAEASEAARLADLYAHYKDRLLLRNNEWQLVALALRAYAAGSDQLDELGRPPQERDAVPAPFQRAEATAGVLAGSTHQAAQTSARPSAASRASGQQSLHGQPVLDGSVPASAAPLPDAVQGEIDVLIANAKWDGSDFILLDRAAITSFARLAMREAVPEGCVVVSRGLFAAFERQVILCDFRDRHEHSLAMNKDYVNLLAAAKEGKPHG